MTRTKQITEHLKVQPNPFPEREKTMNVLGLPEGPELLAISTSELPLAKSFYILISKGLPTHLVRSHLRHEFTPHQPPAA